MKPGTYYEKNRAKCLAISKKYQQEHPEYRLWKAAQARARYQNLPFSITLVDIKIPKLCPVLGKPLTPNTKGPMAPSLDRLDNKLGYTPKNTFVISKRMNAAKQNLTIHEIEMLLNYMKENLS